ncbi:hypothetical protein HGI30_15940 [Paenibacillus albicereus]|uniref:Uncharacterized protein n=1 Tax=Paenibacillus albicereus TaxID=2726185 RepID=A0A6H2GZP4_9BACL|nr:hypothetical protein [Paenibacillus albicereus]QJC52911.1 hypothetical protein HGI30_15940 [Paenibacillus albicereus]
MGYIQPGVSKKEFDDFKNELTKKKKRNWWRTQDWFWVLAMFVYTQGIIFIDNDAVMGIISYGSTFVSFALGAVAIYISVREATKSDVVNIQMHELIGELREKLTQMDTKINKFDPDKKFNDVEDRVNKIVDLKINGLGKEEVNKAEVANDIKENISKELNELKSSLNVNNSTFVRSHIRVGRMESHIDKWIATLEPETVFTNKQLFNEVLEKYHGFISPLNIHKRLDDLCQYGVIEKISDKEYKKL